MNLNFCPAYPQGQSLRPALVAIPQNQNLLSNDEFFVYLPVFEDFHTGKISRKLTKG